MTATEALRFAFVLASSSPRRRELLTQIGLAPDLILTPDVDETPLRDELPRDYVRRVAGAKAEAGFAMAAGHSALARRDYVVLACDTTVAVGRRILGKPIDRADASRMMDLLSGRRHHVLSAVVLCRSDGNVSERLVDSAVTFNRLTYAQREALLDTGEWEGKAGAYSMQGAAASVVRFVSGSHSNIVGLPLFETAQLLRGARLLA